ncbi:P-loop containing nucleoside triphosphate hydrolase [Pseudocohnilembus persalinus]|uniref:p-loop containing nucleoside triphosphate hydrolase n=1 Tax=Pseudocohnilembus persalinus TaxID=266149 RepID=A0A0V0QP46_PSEPJ|nr:P-loop containing nucleoside triphosphate hydrolase [Pseudocohnilembus persalinus]|eukprot:KRX04011.1 P-loop containing nucleoside triphosphate hydrolase [Pseudocohnilembus persalinus]
MVSKNEQNFKQVPKKKPENQAVEMESLKEKKKFDPSPEKHANWLSKLTFAWTNKVINRGVEKNINFQATDYFEIEDWQKTKNQTDILEESRKKQPQSNLLSAIIKSLAKQMTIYSILGIIANCLQFAGPIFLSAIVNLVQDVEIDKDEFWRKGWTYVLILFFCYFLKAFFLTHYNHGSSKMTYAIIQQILSMLFQQINKISLQQRKYIEQGKITNLVVINLVELVMFFYWFFLALSSPFLIIGASIYLIVELSWIGIIGPVQDQQSDLRKKAFSSIDKRSKNLNEFLTGVKAIKYYAWEKYVIKTLEEIRKNELSVLQDISLNIGKNSVISQITPTLISVIIFGIHIWTGGEMTPGLTFTVYSLLNLMQTPFAQIVSGWQQLTNALVAIDRIQYFLKGETFNQDFQSEDLLKKESNVAIKVKNAKFTWSSNYVEEHHYFDPDVLKIKLIEEENKRKKEAQQNAKAKGKKKAGPVKKVTRKCLEELRDKSDRENVQLEIEDLEVKKGEFIGIFGKFSSGKSSLINAIIGEMKKIQGDIQFDGEFSLITQEAWLRSTTLRENITFGSEYQPEKYKKILKICELEADLDQLPGKDMTEIGERGINLSGGQKQRIQIARALYADKQIIIADDVLSALDSYVGQNIFKNVFQQLQGQKTIIFVTHALHYITKFDKILVLNKGKIAQFGKYEDIKNTEAVQDLVQELKKAENDDIIEEQKIEENQNQNQNKNAEISQESELKKSKKSQLDSIQQKAKSGEQQISPKIEKKISEELKETKTELIENESEKKKDDENKKKGAMVKVEKKKGGGIPLKIYCQFIKEGGLCLILVGILFYIVGQFGKMATDYWLSLWTQKDYNSFDLKDNYYLLIFFILAIVTSIIFLIRLLIFIKFTVQSSSHIFIDLVKKIFQAPMSFFDTTPIGRISSRLSQDINNIDYGISVNMSACLTGVFGVISAIIMISIVFPYITILMVVLIIIYVLLTKRYLIAAREMKKLTNSGIGPIIGSYSEINNGMIIIRAFKKNEYLANEFYDNTDNWIRSILNETWCLRWSNLITDILSSLIILGSGIFGLLLRDSSGPEHAGMIGLSITYSLQISLMLPMTAQLVANFELSMDSVYRVLDYINNLEQERSFDFPKKPQNWPKNGHVSIKDIRYRYRDDLPLVIKGISFDIQKCEKVGVIGRTGSGKSTLTLGLLRILELAEYQKQDKNQFEKGEIIIDNKNIEQIGLTDLRNSIAMIPQDPILFTGTVKSNIDPFNQCENKDVLKALVQVSLEPVLQEKLKVVMEAQKKANQGQKVEKIESVLDLPVEQGGANFSQGEKQLLSLARVLVRNPQVLVMDEATASIDEKTDLIIQKMIKEEFQNTTVLTIAHRLNTVMNYDKILVLDNGEIQAFDTPINMMQDTESYLYHQVSANGQEYMQKMTQMAKNNLNSKQK